MIEGSFAPDGTPLVRLNVWLPFDSVRIDVTLVVDTGIAVSRITTFDLELDTGLLLDDLVEVRDGRTSTHGVFRPAVLSPTKGDDPRSLTLHDLLIVDDAPGESRLGRGILNQWLMVYEASGENLLLEPVL